METKYVTVNKQDFQVNENEYLKVPHDEFNNLIILSRLGIQERLISLLKELLLVDNSFELVYIGLSHGGFIPIKLKDFYNSINILDLDESQRNNLLYNMKKFNINDKINLFDNLEYLPSNNYVLFIDDYHTIDMKNTYNKPSIILSNKEIVQHDDYTPYSLSKSEYILYIRNDFNEKFVSEFFYFIKENNLLEYDNLIHLAMIVKNAGDEFENILNQNLPIIDRWTILDTGSTDNTMEIIKKVLVGKKKGQLFQEPFINFRDSRNRCFDLAGKDCKFILTLDDTYIIKEHLREFLETVRGDQFSDSFSLYIKSDDTEYGSNRIIKSETGLRYKYKLHEVIDPKNNKNVIVPIHHGHIFDFRCDYMENRTMERKQYDLKILHEMVEEEPDDSRALYYLGQTYNLVEKYDLALKYFLERVEHHDEGFIQEKIDACFEAARICNFKLNRPWEECEKLYQRAYEMDKSRPDSIYFMGIHHYLGGNYQKAYEYMKLGFEIGYPIHCQYSLKPTLSFYFLPKFLTELCYMFGNYPLGEQAAELFLTKNKESDSIGCDYYTVKCWHKIFRYLNNMSRYTLLNNNIPSKPLLCFVTDGGFEKWSGKDILTKGVGGSETYIIEIARYVQQSGYFNVIVFCNCEKDETFENVEYRKLENYTEFAMNNFVHTTVVSRYPEFLPLCYRCNTENVYLILHDLIPDGEIIADNNKLKQVFCLTDWHSGYLKNMFKTIAHKVQTFNYGIDTNLFGYDQTIQKIPYKFIYSSFPNRGLLNLLRLWPRILEKYPSASLYIHSDVNGKWVNSVVPDTMREIKRYLGEYLQSPAKYNVVYQGWTSKFKLANSFKSADVLLYPTDFYETFCLTAAEAAVSKTLVITSDLGALKDTVSDRGILIDQEKFGKAESKTYDDEILRRLFEVLEDPSQKQDFINRNYEWAIQMTWKNRAYDFINNYLLKNSLIEIKSNVSDTPKTEIPYTNESFTGVNEKLEYLGMYNWTNDLPLNERSREIFEDVIKYFNENNKKQSPKIMEIGVYTGTSLIKILELIPNSTATAIDPWTNYKEKDDVDQILDHMEENNVQEYFKRNLQIMNMLDRVDIRKGKSQDILLEIIEKNEDKYDFIYVDGSHRCLDSYIDMVLSWKLLNSGGILVIDDYPYQKEKVLESPYESTNEFMKQYEKEIKVLSKGYRVFLQKV